MRIPIQEAESGHRGCAFLTSSQVMSPAGPGPYVVQQGHAEYMEPRKIILCSLRKSLKNNSEHGCELVHLRIPAKDLQSNFRNSAWPGLIKVVHLLIPENIGGPGLGIWVLPAPRPVSSHFLYFLGNRH